MRTLVARVIGLFPFVGLIDVLWPLWDNRNQCLHDKGRFDDRHSHVAASA